VLGARELGSSLKRDWPTSSDEGRRRQWLAMRDERDARLADDWSASVGGRELTARDMPAINALIIERLSDLKKLLAFCERFGSTDILPMVRREMIDLNIAALKALIVPGDPHFHLHLGGPLPEDKPADKWPESWWRHHPDCVYAPEGKFSWCSETGCPTTPLTPATRKLLGMPEPVTDVEQDEGCYNDGRCAGPLGHQPDCPARTKPEPPEMIPFAVKEIGWFRRWLGG